MHERVPRARAAASAEPVARAAPAPALPRILALQRSAGNRAVSAMLAAPGAARRARGRHAAAAEADARESLG